MLVFSVICEESVVEVIIVTLLEVVVSLEVVKPIIDGVVVSGKVVVVDDF